MNLRRNIGTWLRYRADRIDPDGAPRAIGAHFNFVMGVGMVITQTDGVSISPPAPGCPLWYIGEDDYARAWLPHSEISPRSA